MTKSKVKALFISFLLAAVAVCLSLAFVACKGGDKDSDNYGVGEEGVYYYDKDASTEYLMSLQSGTYMISAEGAKGYAGTYSYDESEKSISFKTDGGESFSASFSDDAMQLAIENTPYTFLKKVNYTVTFVDGNTSTTKSVTYGRQATAPEKDESRIFIGWFTDSAFTSSYKFDTAVTGDLTLYAYYIDIDATIANYDVTFVDGGETVYETKTQNGIVYDIPDYDGILGWWVSDTNKEDTLTYKYEGQTLNEATKLFAVKEGSLGVSVYGDKITWEATVSSVSITVDGVNVASSATGNSFAYDFSSLSTGAHEVLVRASGYGDENLVYVVNGLSRVSNFSVYGNVLVYNAVENAQYYCISVTCGNSSHDHEMVYNGNTLTYDFSNCEMGKDGITFTVYACAAGYVKSVSETFVYSLILDGTTVTIDKSSDTATWTAVSDATGYEVYVDESYAETVTGTEYSFKYYKMGDEIAISVKPVAPGYYSEASDEVSYTKATLRTPEITGINAYTVSWSYIKEATNYIIYVNGKQFETVSNDITSYALMGDSDFVQADSYVITVKAVNAGNTNQNSQLSDEVIATDSELAPLLVYEDGIVYWQYAMAAGTYYVSVNDGDEMTVDGKNSFAVTFTQSGENVIKVWFTTDAGEKSLAQISVTAYAVIFNSEGGTIVDTIYVAKGDTLNLDTPTYSYGSGENTFLGWYTLPNPEGVTSTNYLGDGYKVENGSVFSSNGTLILYACWEILKSNTRLVVGEYGNINGESETYYEIPVNTASYELPVPDATDAKYVFYGWYSEPNGRGTQYTYYDGSARNSFSNTNVSTIYAYWIQVLDFKTTSYAGESYAAVSKGSSIGLAPNGEVTVPSEYTIDGVTYTVGVVNSDAFTSCSSLVTINLPDTIVYISTTNDGYTTGSGAFSSSANLKEVNIYSEGTDHNTAREIKYYSYDGVLYMKGDDGGVELIYYPSGKTDSAFDIPEYVVNENEYELNGLNEVKVYRPVTSIAQRGLYTRSMTSVTIPATVSYIGIQAFQSCTYLTTVTFKNTVESGEVTASTTLELGSKAFQRCTALQSVVLPSRLGSFLTDVFDDCTNFTYISIADGGTYSSYEGILYSSDNAICYCPRGRVDDVIWKSAVTRVEEGAFEGCTKLTSLAIPASVTYIGVSAFNGCTGLTSLTFVADGNALPLVISAKAFYGCTRIERVDIPSRAETIGEQAFAGCTRLTYVYYDSSYGTDAEDIDFAEGAFGTTVTTLEFGANVPLLDNFVLIFGSSNLTTVTISQDNGNYTEDSSGVIYGLYDEDSTILMWTPVLTGTYTVLDGCTVIGAEAFMNKTGIRAVVIPASVTEIRSSAFYGCTNLSSVTFAADSGLTTIGSYAFANTAITTITIPASVQYMGEYEGDTLIAINIFDGCSALSEIIVESGNEYFATYDGILYMVENGNPTQLIVCPVNNAVTEIEIPSTVVKIWDNAFYDNKKMEKVTFENGTVDEDFEFGDSVFYNCTSLKEVDLPTGLTTIPAMLFQNCTALESITIPYTVTYIGGNVFYNCSSLSDVTFDDVPSDKSLSDYPLVFEDSSLTKSGLCGTFYNCDSLVEIDLPDRTTTIAGRVFSYCDALEIVTLGANIETIPQYAFYYCYGLKQVVFGNKAENEVKLETIETFAFCYVSDSAHPLSIELPSSMRTIGSNAFYWCYVASLALNEGLEEISGSLFGSSTYNKSTITEVTIPASLTTLGTQAFYGCSYLKTVTFAEGCGLTEIASNVFRATAVEKIEIPACIESIGDYAFGECASLVEIVFLTGSDGLSQTVSLGKQSFFNCTSLETFTFPETGTDLELGDSMFKGCKNLKKLVLSSEMTSLGSALNGCYSVTEIDTDNCNNLGSDPDGAPILYTKVDGEIAGTLVYVFGDVTGEFVVPETVSEIDAKAFTDQVGITSLKLPVTLTKIGNYAFDGCINLKTITFYEVEGGFASTITIGAAAFRQTAISEFDFSVFTTVNIGSMAFAQNDNLKTVILAQNVVLQPDSTTSTGTGVEKCGAFAYCTALETVVLGGLIAIPNYAFYEDKSLKTIAQSVDEIEEGTFDLRGVSVGTFAFTEAAVEKVVFSSTTTISSSSTSNSPFGDCDSLKYVVLGGLTNIPAYTFYGCDSLECLADSEEGFYIDGIPVVDLSTLTAYNTYTFGECPSIQMIVINPSIQVGVAMFYKCTGLTTIALLDGTSVSSYEEGVADLRGANIAKAAFNNAGLEYVMVSTSTTIEAGSGTGATAVGAFGNCPDLVCVDLGGCTSISKYLFYKCASLTTLLNAENITEVADDGLYGCTSLECLDANGLMTVGGSAFYNCYALKTVGDVDGVVDVSNVASFGSSAFYNCTSLEKIIVLDKTSITDSMFNGCSSLVALATSYDGMYIDGNPVVDLTGMSFATASSSSKTQFNGCTSMETLILGEITTLGACAFYGCASLCTIAKSNQSVVFGTADLSGIYMYKAVFYGSGIEKLVLSSASTITAGSGTTTSSGVFAESLALETVILGGLNNITQGTFYGCLGLKTIADTEAAAEEGVAHLEGLILGIAAVANTGLEKIVMDEDTTLSQGSTAGTGVQKAWSIAENACLEEVILGVDTIPTYGFYGCTSLTTLAIDEGSVIDGVINLTGITASATYIFYGCESITEVVFGDNRSFSDYAFYGCTSLATIGDNFQVADLSGISLGLSAMYQTGVVSLVLSSDTSLTAGENATNKPGMFAECLSLRYVDLGGMTTVPNYTFYGCTELIEVSGADSLTTIGTYAFSECESLTTLGSEGDIVNLSNVTSIGDRAFSYCTSLSAFEATGNAFYSSVDGILYDADGNIAVVPGALSGVVTVADGVETIGSYAFMGNNNITEVIIPESVTSIGSYAFYKCEDLVSVAILGDGVTTGSYAFAYCYSLKTVETKNGLGTIGGYTFYNCYDLEDVKIGDTAESIGNYAFYYCTSLSEIVIPTGVISIGTYAFRYSSLGRVTIPYTVTSIGQIAFADCDMLVEVVFEDLPDGYSADDYPLTISSSTSTGSFTNCTALKEIELPARLVSLGAYTFSGCTLLETATVRGNGLSDIGTYVFQSCDSLTAVYIEGGVEIIGKYMFYKCAALEIVTIPDTVIEICDYAFQGCTSLKSIVIPESVETMGTEVFNGTTSETTIYIEGSYKYSTMLWLSYTSTATTNNATREKWKENSDAKYAYYLEIPDDASNLVEDLTYWYYDTTGDIVEWTVADLNV